jgi:hypothetical protein
VRTTCTRFTATSGNREGGFPYCSKWQSDRNVDIRVIMIMVDGRCHLNEQTAISWRCSVFVHEKDVEHATSPN